MSHSKIAFAGLFVDEISGWFDVTEDIAEGSAFTLAKGDEAFGALQFSSGLYKKGGSPEITQDDLEVLLRDFLKAHGLASTHGFEVFHERVVGVGATCLAEGELIKVWYVSNGNNVTLVTYIAEDTDDPIFHKEVEEAFQIVRSIQYE